jgi:hypothetical protein
MSKIKAIKFADEWMFSNKFSLEIDIKFKNFKQIKNFSKMFCFIEHRKQEKLICGLNSTAKNFTLN